MCKYTKISVVSNESGSWLVLERLVFAKNNKYKLTGYNNNFADRT